MSKSTRSLLRLRLVINFKSNVKLKVVRIINEIELFLPNTEYLTGLGRNEPPASRQLQPNTFFSRSQYVPPYRRTSSAVTEVHYFESTPLTPLVTHN